MMRPPRTRSNRTSESPRKVRRQLGGTPMSTRRSSPSTRAMVSRKAGTATRPSAAQSSGGAGSRRRTFAPNSRSRKTRRRRRGVGGAFAELESNSGNEQLPNLGSKRDGFPLTIQSNESSTCRDKALFRLSVRDYVFEDDHA